MSTLTPSADWTRYAEHRTGLQVQQLLHHGHPIPVSHGLTDAHVAAHFPGWTWNALMAVWRAAGILDGRPSGSPPQCDPRVKAVHFNGPDDVAVEWLDGSVTTG